VTWLVFSCSPPFFFPSFFSGGLADSLLEVIQVEREDLCSFPFFPSFSLSLAAIWAVTPFPFLFFLFCVAGASILQNARRRGTPPPLLSLTASTPGRRRRSRAFSPPNAICEDASSRNWRGLLFPFSSLSFFSSVLTRLAGSPASLFSPPHVNDGRKKRGQNAGQVLCLFPVPLPW